MAIRFGVIFIVDFLRAISVDDKNKQLRSILERKKKCNSIKFYELYSSITEITAFVVFTDESDAIFNLKNYLLVLSKNFNNSRNIWYCENFVRDDESSFFLENNKTIDDLNLEDLLGRLKTQAFPLSDTITNAINEKEEGVALDYALINDIKYNLLDNTFHFIFDVGNPLLKESSQLIVEVPREALDLENVDKLVECIMQSPYISYSSYLRGRVIPESSLVIILLLKVLISLICT
ncbi:hypothetical protein HpVH80_08860 [Helicobacter pylori]|nr:hypothetical protein [Helicobacter pylori]GHP79017.1 hypothetical protein VN1199_13660 [Helicobacter pylori]